MQTPKARGGRSVEAIYRKPTIRDVADAAEVSVGTVSRVLNEHPSVSTNIRERVMRAVNGLGYERDPIAQSLRSGRSRMIACAIGGYNISSYAPYIRAAEQVCREANYTFVLAITNNSQKIELSLLQNLAQRKIDGAMLTLSNEMDPALVAAVKSSPLHYVLIDRERIQSMDRVFVDHRSGALQALNHLISLGHSRIAMLVGDPNAHPSRSRLEAYREAFELARLPFDSGLVRSYVVTAEAAAEETTRLMSMDRRPSAIFVAGMDLLPGALRALKHGAWTVGRDVSIVSGNDSDLAELMHPPITAVRWDFAEMGRQAATMLIERIEGAVPVDPRSARMPSTLIVRESSCPFRAPD